MLAKVDQDGRPILDQGSKGELATLLAEVMAEWSIDLELVRRLTKNRKACPIRTPLAWLTFRPCHLEDVFEKVFRGATCIGMQGTKSLSAKIGKSHTLNQLLVTFCDFRRGESAEVDNLCVNTQKEQRASDEELESASRFCQSTDTMLLPEKGVGKEGL